MRKRKIQTLSKEQADAVRGMQYIGCSKCGDDVPVSMDVSSVICDYCVQMMIPAPELPVTKSKSEKPRGWHFKKFFEFEGIVYSFGEVVSDASEITKLKKENGPVKKVTKKQRSKTVKRGRKNARTTK